MNWINAPTMELSDAEVRSVPRVSEPVSEPVASTDELIGQRIANYDIESILGQGGMGRVYRAKHRTLERPCAIKILNQQLLAQNREYADLFLSEARTAASLVHPNIVTIHNVGNEADRHFIEMEFVVGRSLSHVVESQGPLGVNNATRLMMQVSSALSIAHSSGMVHRDIKPANVLLSQIGDAKLADFGLAKRVTARDDQGKFRNLSGTPYFMAPELFSGQPADVQSDIYAMGVTYFVLLTGQLPYPGRSVPELAFQHESQQIPDVRASVGDIPDEVAQIVAKALSKSPLDRQHGAKELHNELSSVYGCMRSLKEFLQTALAGESAQILPDEEFGTTALTETSLAENRFKIEVQLAGQRSQLIYVESSTEPSISQRIVRIYSICGPADESYYRRALEINASLPHGALAIEQLNGVPHFVMTNSYPKATCDTEELRKSILSIAQHADYIESVLSPDDRH